MLLPPPRSTLFPYTTLFRSLEDGLPRREHERIAHERPAMLVRQGELARDDRADQERFARPHCKSEDVARVVECQRFAKRRELVLGNQTVVGFEGLKKVVQTKVGNRP